MTIDSYHPSDKKQTNLYRNNFDKDFFFWVNPKNHIIFTNISLIGFAFSNPVPVSNPEENLLFIPNPKFTGFITPYQNNIAKRMRAEYWLEIFRPPEYPSRPNALFICNTEEDAIEYSSVHRDHTNGRVLISGVPDGENLYSIHDSGWFDFLCKDASLDVETAQLCAIEYWLGSKVCDCELELYGNPWTQRPTMEVLFYGKLKITDVHREIISEIFKKAYLESPKEYPPMNL
jgi:hypothetical protein